MMLKFITTIILFILIQPLFAQEVSNVQVLQNGEELKVTFDIDEQIGECLVKIELAKDGEHFDLLGELEGRPGKNEFFHELNDPIYIASGIFRVQAVDKTFQLIFNDMEFIEMGKKDGFLIGKFEVTQKQWIRVMGNNPSHFQNCPNCPVESVSWNDVQKFIQKLNDMTGRRYRLPTEAEWEYAARGGIKSSSYQFSGSNDIGLIAWYERNSGSKTHPVGEKQPNELGLYDMSGNVWEWCNDLKENDYSSERSIPIVHPGNLTETFRVRRGGSVFSSTNYCLPDQKNFFHSKNSNDDLGFRLVHPSL